ncbi:MAG: hypothetical protein K2N34_07485 [Lachnospiraceae bacterium]|nr:hypothetical protein [Lachnospiraceae bacterium]
METKNEKYLNLALYLISFLAIILTPLAARLISPLFDWAGYGAMRGFFDELFTSLLWIAEIIILVIFYRVRFKYKIIFNDKVKGQILPLKRIFIISGIVAACILVISAQIGFQVKPFYDLGEKFNGYQFLNNIGIFLRNMVKCVWIVIMIKAAVEFFEQIPRIGTIKYFYVGLAMILTVGVYDIVMKMNNLPVTYLFLYLIYEIIYLLTDRHPIKSFLLILFIYLF